MSENYLHTIAENKIYPIIRCKDAERTVEIAKAMIDGGINVLEINVENIEIYEAIKEVSKYATVCAGGCLSCTRQQGVVRCYPCMLPVAGQSAP